MTARIDPPTMMGAQVVVAHYHPRTGACGTFPGILHGRLSSGRLRVFITIEGKRLIVTTDPENVRGAA